MIFAQKKTPDRDLKQSGLQNTNADYAHTRYESLRCRRHEISENVDVGDWQSFQLFGLLGLLRPPRHAPYIVEVHQASAPRWCGRIDPQEKVFVRMFRQLTTNCTNSSF